MPSWSDLINNWLNRYKDSKRRRQHGKGICSVFILDTSESMAGEGGRQMKMAMSDILNGILSLNC